MENTPSSSAHARPIIQGLLSFVTIAVLSAANLPAQNFYAWGGTVPNNTINNFYPQTVAGVGALTGTNRLARVCLSITQPIPNDLDIYLISPTGTQVRLSDDNGGSSGNDYHTGLCFSECGPTGAIVGASDFKGTYTPEQLMSAFNNGQNADGTWQLRVDDDAAAGGNGTLNYWSLDFGTTVMPTNPTGHTCPSAFVLNTLPYSHTCMTLVGSGNDYTNGACSGHIDGSEYVFAYTPTTAGEFLSVDAAQDFAAPSGFPTINLLDACPNVATPANCIATEIQFSSTDNILHISSQPLTAGTTYYIVVASTSGTGGNYDIRIASGRNGSSNCLTATNITSTGEYAGNNYTAPAPNTLAPNTTEMSCNGSIDNFIFYTFTTDASGTDVHASITDIACNLSCGGACGVQVALFRAPVGGACQGPGTWGPAVFCGTSTTTNAYYNWTGLLPNTQYYLMVDGTAGSQCVWNLRVLGGVQQTVFPVSMTAFSVVNDGPQNQLRWETMEELNADRFEIEHGQSATEFQKVATVAARGNTHAATRYTYDDGHVEPGWHYYRLKIVDQNGSSTYSTVEKVLIEAQGDYFALYPNPAREELNLCFLADGLREVQVLGVDGHLWQQFSLDAEGILATRVIDIGDLAPGVYVLQVRAANGDGKVMKFVKI